ncbi:MAG: hypothetical protein K1X47_16390 [Cyclobacteriaceae bacterium]|nr:hypothetical protein [Cyclobacteriaceae bacterium]
MNSDRSITDRIAEKVGDDPDLVRRIIEEFCLELRKNLDSYKGMNGDYLGEQLHWEISTRAFFHLLGFLDAFSGKYQWEPGSAREYILRLYSEEDWKPFSQEYMTPNGNTETQTTASAGQQLGQFSGAASACAMSLMSNADYVLKELANVQLPEDVRTHVEVLCNDWIGTKHDVIHELGELDDQVNVADRVRRIMSWLSEDIVKLQNQLRELESLANRDEQFKLAYLLVGESGGNVLRSFVTAGEAADRLLAESN